MTTAPRAGRQWLRSGGQYVQNNFYGAVDAPGAQIGIVNASADVEVDPPSNAEDAARMLFGDPRQPVAGSLTWWLDPRAGIVPAEHRPEADGLLAWCTAETGPVVRLVCGQGGQGKTRLALSVCDALATAEPAPAARPRPRWQSGRRPGRQQRGWLAGFVRLPELSWQRCGDAERFRWGRLVAAVRAVPTLGVTGALLVVDYPEGHPQFVQELVYEAIQATATDTATDTATGARTRVLLLARAEPDWWRNICDVAPNGTVERQPLALASLQSSLASPNTDTEAGEAATTGELWEAAVEAFADRAAAENLQPLAEQARAALTAQRPERFATTLDLYADALLRVLDHAAGPAARTWRSGDPLLGVLQHDQQLFARGAGLTVLGGGLRRDLAVSVAFLHPAAGMDAATRALAAAPELSHLTLEELRQTAQALTLAYPSSSSDASGAPPGDSVWQAPQPDRLPDTHLLDTAQRCKSDTDWCEHVTAVCGIADPTVAGHAARILVRVLSTPGAAARYPGGLRRVELSIAALLRQHPAQYVPLLVTLDPARFGRTIVELLDTAVVPAASVAQVDADLRAMGFTTTRTTIAVAVSQRLAGQTRPPAGDPATHAEHLVLLSRRLAEAGALSDALPPARAAVDIYRQLPDITESGLTAPRAWYATALTNLGNRLAEHGAAIEALTVTDEAAALRRELAEAGGSQLELAYAMNNLALRLLDVDRPGDAVAPAREAVALLDALASAEPVHRPRLAVALISLTRVLAAAGLPGEAVAPAERAVLILRELAELQPASYLPNLAAALVTLSQVLAPVQSRGKRTSRTVRAVELAAEAVDIYHRLDSEADGVSAFRADLAGALTNLGLRQADAARTGEAAAQTQRAITIQRELAATDPGLHRADLAVSLTNLGLQLVMSHGGAAALAPAKEAVALYRVDPAAPTVSATDPGPHPDLAATLLNLGYVLAAAGRLNDATAASGEAVTIYRRLLMLSDEPQVTHQIWLADALVNLARHHIKAGDGAPSHAVDALLAAIDLYAQVADTHPHAAYDRFRAALALLATAGGDTTAVVAVTARVPTPSRKDADRYCRRWYEVAVRSSLPGVAAGLAAWRTDLAPPLSRRRPVRDELIALLDRRRATSASSGAEAREPAGLPTTSLTTTAATTAATTASTAAASTAPHPRRAATTSSSAAEQPGRWATTAATTAQPGRLATVVTKAGERVRAAITTTASRLAGIPGMDTVVQYIHANPAALVRFGGVFALIAALLTVIPSLNSPNDPQAQQPPSTSAEALPPPSQQPASTTPPTPPLSTPPPAPTSPPPGPTTLPAAPVGNLAPIPPSPPSPSATTTTPITTAPTTPPPTPGPSTTSQPSVPPLPPPVPPPTTTQRPDQPAPPSQFAITIDASAASYENIAVDATSNAAALQGAGPKQSFTLKPGTHQLITPNGSSTQFSVTTTGRVEYDPVHDNIFSGRDTDTLIVRGVPIAINAAATSYTTYTVSHTALGTIPKDQSPTFNLVPGYHSLDLAGNTFYFEVTPAGRIEYDTAQDNIFTGRNTTTLTLNGLPITIDARSTTLASFSVPEVTGPVDARQTNSFRLLPGTHQVVPSTGTPVVFSVTAAGNVDYDAGLDDVVDGRGTPTLLFRGPRWGYVWMSRYNIALDTTVAVGGPYQWGTWKKSTDPAMANRVPMVTHQGTGVFLVRMPGLGSDKDTAHVTIGWYGYLASCVVHRTERAETDELILVGCFDSSGTAKDVPFHLLFAEPSARGAPTATIRYDVPGGTASADPLSNPATINTAGGANRVTRLEQGRYRATIEGPGFGPNGYAQITPRGNKPVWCQNAGTSLAGASLQIDVDCYALGTGARADTEWALSYVQDTPLSHDLSVLGAYAQTTLTPPGLFIDPARSYNGTGGAMTVLRDNAGNYLVGFKAAAVPGSVYQAVALGPKPAYCRVEGWGLPTPGEVWVRVVCSADVPFGVAVLRPPGGATGTLTPTPPPAVHPPGPKWAHAKVGVSTYNIPTNIETEIDPDEQWGTWVRTLSQWDARWARRATVVRLDTGEYRVRLPGVGSPTGIPHVTVSGQLSFPITCAARDYWQEGADELVRVACFSGVPSSLGKPANVPFSVLFTEPAAGATPAATIRYGVAGGSASVEPLSNSSTVNSTGGAIGVRREATGTYTAMVDGAAFDATGQPKITPLTPPGATPVWCQSTGAERAAAGMRISIGCWDFTKTPAQPRDSEWLLTYEQGAPLTHDPSVPGAYARTSLTPPMPAIDQDHSYSSTRGAMRVLRIYRGWYWVGFRGAGAHMTGANTFQITATGAAPGTCFDAGHWAFGNGVVWMQVKCFGATRAPQDMPFDIAAIRPPYGPTGSPDPIQPGPAPPGPRWGYAYMNAIDAPMGVETGLHPGLAWGTWLGTLEQFDAWWLAQSTVVREATGVSRVRLPNIGSPSGIPHVTVFPGAAGDACAVRDFAQSGADELVRVSCYDGSGRPKDVKFSLFFGDPSTGGTPTVATRSDTPGDGVHITRLEQGSYRATVDGPGFDGKGYAQVTPLGGQPVRCQNTGVSMAGAALQIDINCYGIGTAAPLDTEWLLTYVQGAPLSHDTREPGAYAQTTIGPNGLAIDETRSYTSNSGAITLVRDGTGAYRVRFAGIARVGWAEGQLINGHTAQVVTLGSTPGYCITRRVGFQDFYAGRTVAEVQVQCYDAAGQPADMPFGVALVRRP